MTLFSGGRGRRRAAVSTFQDRLGWASAMPEALRFGVRWGDKSAWAAFEGLGGWALRFVGVSGGGDVVHWVVWVCGVAWGSLR